LVIPDGIHYLTTIVKVFVILFWAVLAFIGEALIRFAVCGAAYLENVKSCIKTLMKRNMKKMTSGERLLSNPEA